MGYGEIFLNARNIAVVGISGKQERDSFRVADYMQKQGYRIIPVNPAIEEVLGEKCYPDLLSVPAAVPVDVVNIFRKPEAVLQTVEEAIQRGSRVVWMQLRITNEEAAARAREAGLEVIMNRCIMVEHGKWAGGQK